MSYKNLVNIALLKFRSAFKLVAEKFSLKNLVYNNLGHNFD